jgi:hypothetical protein
VDGRASKYLSSSPYHYCANNPVRMIDLDGNQFTDAAEQWAQRLGAEADRKLAENSAEITRLFGTVAGKMGKAGIKALNKVAKQINRLLRQNAELGATQSELATLRNSSQLYHVETTSGQVTSADGRTATSTSTTSFDRATGAVVMTVNTSSGNELASFAHEAKHAFQFETKRMDFAAIRGQPGWWYEIGDEMEAFNRGQIFGANAKINITERWVRKHHKNYKDLPQGPLDANTPHPDGGTYGSRAENAAATAGYNGYQPNQMFKGWMIPYQAGAFLHFRFK